LVLTILRPTLARGNLASNKQETVPRSDIGGELSTPVRYIFFLFPVFARAREKAVQTTCLSNVKQLNLACLMYAEDYDGTLPIGIFWYAEGKIWYWVDALEPYLKNKQVAKCANWPKYTFSYAYNSKFGRIYADGTFKDRPSFPLGRITEPALTLLLGECDRVSPQPPCSTLRLVLHRSEHAGDVRAAQWWGQHGVL